MSTVVGEWRDVADIPLSPVLAGALEVFSQHGYHGASVRQIADQVGVTVPALYYHHPSKEAMLAELLRIVTDALADRVESAITEAAGDRAMALANAVQAITIHMTSHQKLASLDKEARYLSAEHRAIYAVPRRRIEKLVSGVIAAGVAEGVFATTEPREAARGLLGMLQWLERWYRPTGALTIADISDKYTRLALDLVRHQPQETQS